MGVGANGYGFFAVGGRRAAQRLQQDGPTAFPELQNFGAAAEGVDELVVPVAPGLFAVGRQGISPARSQVSRDVLHDDGNRVGVLVERQVELVVGQLFDGSIGQALVGLEGVED